MGRNIPGFTLAAMRMMNCRSSWLPALFAVLLAAGAIPASHAEYPERTIKIVVPFPAGGPTDVAARLIAQSISTRLGQSVVVENHAGAGGRIGAKVVAGAAPDGYTLLLGGTNVNAIADAIYKDLGFDPIASFVPIAAISAEVGLDGFGGFAQRARRHLPATGQIREG